MNWCSIFRPCVRIEKSEENSYVAMVTMKPKLPEDQLPQSEMIFVVDRSGSMR